MGPGSVWNGQRDQLALRQTTWSGGNGTNRTAPHEASDILSHAGPPVSVPEEREGSLDARVT